MWKKGGGRSPSESLWLQREAKKNDFCWKSIGFIVSQSPWNSNRDWTSRRTLEPLTLFGEFSVSSKKSWPPGNFFHMNSFSDLNTPNWSYNLFLGLGSFSENSVMWGERFSQLKGAKRTNSLLTRKSQFAYAPYYSSRQKGFPSHIPGHAYALKTLWEHTKSFLGQSYLISRKLKISCFFLFFACTHRTLYRQNLSPE